MDYQLQEGSIALPEGFQDRTVNMFILGSNIPAPLNITISRDNVLPAEDLDAY
ncbi:DcrB-related protein, partial [Pseudomonas putida]|nr:DcrB-related protein [Pseudomonas putida]